LLNFARSYGPTVQKVQVVTGTASCLQYAGISQAQGAALLFHAQVRLQAASEPSAECPWLVMDEKNLPLLEDRLQAWGWTLEATAARLGERSDRLMIFRPAQPTQDTSALPEPAKN
jgi:hypothetical protein